MRFFYLASAAGAAPSLVFLISSHAALAPSVTVVRSPKRSFAECLFALNPHEWARSDGWESFLRFPVFNGDIGLHVFPITLGRAETVSTTDGLSVLFQRNYGGEIISMVSVSMLHGTSVTR